METIEDINPESLTKDELVIFYYRFLIKQKNKEIDELRKRVVSISEQLVDARGI